MSDMQTKFVEANGLRFEVLEEGTGDRLALCLHGFPEHAISWRYQIPVLAGMGYRVWAVNQRGYGRTTRPTQGVALPPDVLAVCTRQITEPGAATAMLNWYRAIRLRSSRTLNLAQVIDVPILVIWGERDLALDPSC